MRPSKCLSAAIVLFAFSGLAPTAFSAEVAKTGARPLASQQVESAMRPMKFLPSHSFEVMSEGSMSALRFDPPLPPNDGNMYAAVLDAIGAIHPAAERGAYIGPKLFLKRLPDGSNAIALDAGKYLYVARPYRISEQDRRIWGMGFWRESK